MPPSENNKVKLALTQAHIAELFHDIKDIKHGQKAIFVHFRVIDARCMEHGQAIAGNTEAVKGLHRIQAIVTKVMIFLGGANLAVIGWLVAALLRRRL